MTAILIVRLGALGDVVHAMPVVAALRRQWPDARIDWLVDPRYADVVGFVSGLSRAIPFNPRGLLAGRERGHVMATLGELRRQRYDAVFDLQGLMKSAVIARLAGGAQTFGFSRSQLREPAARLFYTRTIDVAPAQHVIEKNLALVAAAGVEIATPRFALSVPVSPLVQRLRGRFGKSGYVAMNPGAAWPNKRWPVTRFGQVAARINALHAVRSLVVWGPGEEALAQGVVAASDGAAEMAPATEIAELFAVLGSARLAIAGDTGPLHIAVAVGTPVVALFGPTDPARNGPWDRRDVTISRNARCECHYQRRCRRAVPCIDDIEVDEVVTAVATRLSRVSGESV